MIIMLHRIVVSSTIICMLNALGNVDFCRFIVQFTLMNFGREWNHIRLHIIAIFFITFHLKMCYNKTYVSKFFNKNNNTHLPLLDCELWMFHPLQLFENVESNCKYQWLTQSSCNSSTLIPMVEECRA